MNRKAPGDHAAQLIEHTTDQHFEQVDGDEDDESHRGDEVDRARRLPTADQADQPAEHRIQMRRHRQPHQHDHRRQDINHDDVGELLQDVVAQRFLAHRMLETQVVDDRAAKAAPVALGRQKIAAGVVREPCIQQKTNPVEHQYPREEEMPTAAECKILLAR